ncbi:hypothetical protein IKA92_01770, partial [bacterium]|nr:hypothetical protein [bacterium]
MHGSSGLITTIASGGKVQNLTIDNAQIVATATSGQTGILVGENFGTITNVHITNGFIKNETGTTGYIGGLAGYNNGGTITLSSSSAAVKTKGTGAGGLVGWNYKGTINKSWATGEVIGNKGYTGGLVGGNGEATISNCYATGKVSLLEGNNYVGGLVGYNPNSTVTNSYYSSEYSNHYSTTVGTAKDASWFTDANIASATGITKAELGDVSGITEAQAKELGYAIVSTAAQLKAALDNNQSVYLKSNINLSGYSWNNTTTFTGAFIGNGYEISNLSGSTGLFGTIDGATIKDVTLKNFSVNNSSGYAGALANTASGTTSFGGDGITIENVKVSGGSVKGTYYVGGLIGSLYVSDSNQDTANIINCSSSASVSASSTGDSCAGGLIGRIDDNIGGTNIINSYSTGSVTASGNCAGGLVGYVLADTGGFKISNSYATGSVHANEYGGGLVGYVKNDSKKEINIEDSYFSGIVTIDVYEEYYDGTIYWGYAGNIIGGASWSSSTSYIKADNVYYVDDYFNRDINSSGLSTGYSDSVYAKDALWFNAAATKKIVGYDTVSYVTKQNVVDAGYSYVTTEAELKSALNGDKNIYLANDITISGSWSAYSWSGEYFYGNDFTITRTSSSQYGLFYNLDRVNSGTYSSQWIHDLTLSGFTVSSSSYDVGALANRVSGDRVYIYNTHVKNANVSYTGSGTCYAGGLIGDIEKSGSASIHDSSSSGTVTNSNTSSGGLIGNVSGEINTYHTYSTANVTGKGYCGGLIGRVYIEQDGAYVDINDSYASGTVSSTWSAGGLLGSFSAKDGITLDNFDISSSHSFGDVIITGNDGYTAGGLVGSINAGEGSAVFIDDCASLSNVTGGSAMRAGGFAGEANSDGGRLWINGCASSGNVTGGDYCGGFVGRMVSAKDDGSQIKGSFSSGTASGGSSKTAGFIAHCGAYPTFDNCLYNSTTASDSHATATDPTSTKLIIGEQFWMCSFKVADAKTLRGAIMLNGDIELVDNINLSGISWNTGSARYESRFDGNGFTISDLSSSTQGLFNEIGRNVNIKNLTLKNFNISTSSAYYSGALANVMEGGSVNNVHVVSGSVSNSKGSGYGWSGGLIGEVMAGLPGASYSVCDYYTVTIKNCSTSNSVSGNSCTGGLIGFMCSNGYAINIENTWSSGSVT